MISKGLYGLVLGVLLFAPALATAQEPSGNTFPAVEQQRLLKARVLEASPSTKKVVEGTSITTDSQTLTIEVLEGEDEGRTITFENDFTQLEKGDVFYVRHIVGGFHLETWAVSDPYRLDILLWIGLAFLLLVFLFGGLQGIRGVASLGGSLVLIFYLLLPSIHNGISPILVSLGVASLIILVGSYITHGFNRTTTAAMLGMIATIVITGIATYLAIDLAQLSGFTSDENVYLNFNTEGRIDMVGLLFGGIMIGLLGVLYDSAIGQAVAVEELYRAGANYTRKQVYLRGLRIGREHIGALVNTLAIAYVGASLPLLLLLKQSTASPLYLLNSEIFATEIIRILMSSIGIILAVPVTTLIATYMLKGARASGLHSHAK
ncbi:MAG: YibE/F family protein [bacterium]|nr:YibE/F family protein [bacterium]